MNAFLQTLRSLGPVKLAAMAGVTLVSIVFFIFITTRLTTPDMALLFGDLEPRDSARIVTQLEQQNVPYTVSADGSQISVPGNDAARLRLQLAEQGLSGQVTGYELFDRDQGLGSSSFVQNINHVRALEGELARTIASLAPVQGARVHLVLPRRELFSRTSQDPSASVVLKMRGARRLDSNQVLAVQHLVAAAVPGMDPGDISIIDDRGTLLARGGDDAAGTFNGLSANEMRSNLEARLTRTLEQLIEPIVGVGNVRTEVRAELSFDREVINEERFDPEGQVVRSTQAIEETSSNRDGGQDPVTVGNNLPDPPELGQEQTGSESNEARTEEATNYEISKTVRNVVREAGEIERLSVAVLVNGTFAGGESGERTYQPRNEQELQQIDRLVKSAIGFDPDRNDVVQVVNLQFADLDQSLMASDGGGLFGLDVSGELVDVARTLALGLIGVVFVFVVVRPLLRMILEMSPAAAGRAGSRQDEERGMITDQGSGHAGMLEGPRGDGDGMSTATALAREAEHSEMIDISQVDGRVKMSSIRKIGEIVDKHPEEAVAILRTWMYQER